MLPILTTALLAATCHTVPVTPTPAQSIYDFTMKDIDGKNVPLSKFKGKTLLIVNVASFCGFTPQYEGLEALYKEKKDQGLVVLGFPANNFREQEPGTDAEIKTFCTSKYSVTFPMFSKISVKGADTAPLYKWLIANSDRPKDDIEWNFCKFLISKDGKVLKRMTPKDAPNSASLRDAVIAALSPQ